MPFYPVFAIPIIYRGFLTHKFFKICVTNSNKTLYLVAFFMQKKILQFSQTFLQKDVAISQTMC